MQRDLVDSSTILLVRAGSHAYGTNTPTSDLDVRGVMIPPMDYYLGLKRVEQYQEKGDGSAAKPDLVVYELQKYLTLAADANPNILELVFCDDGDILSLTLTGRLLRENRHLFLSKKAQHTFSGYAMAQLKKIESHRAAQKGARSELERRFGYDTKHGMHLVRLMRMCAEILTDGTVHVRRPDAAELLSIRQGAWSYDHLITWAREQNALMNTLAAKSSLPHSPDHEAIGMLCRKLIETTR